MWFLSPREISNAGYNTCSKVSDVMVHNAWNWPSSWLIKAPELWLVPTPSIQMDTSDVYNGVIRTNPFQIFQLRRHAFLLWLVMHNSLKTQDRLKQWDVGINTDLNLLRCSLCDLQADLREHLFFKCSYSTQVWATVRRLASMDNVPPVLQNIMLYLQPMAHKRIAKSIIGKILLAAAIYFIWIERNNRLFKDIKKNPEELCDMIMITVRLKLTTLRTCYALLEVAQDSRSRISQPSSIWTAAGIDYIMGDRMTLRDTQIRSFQTHLDHRVAIHTSPISRHIDAATAAGTLILTHNSEQQRRARQPGPEARIPDHQDASGDADSHI
ncbi:putative reverse transcriptase domain-containing protein [Tanacetum coccineum]